MKASEVRACIFCKKRVAAKVSDYCPSHEPRMTQDQAEELIYDFETELRACTIWGDSDELKQYRAALLEGLMGIKTSKGDG